MLRNGIYLFCMILITTSSINVYAGNCYRFQNNTAGPIKIGFNYSFTLGDGFPLDVIINPNNGYPFDGNQWCWNTPDGYTATPSIINGVGKFTINGKPAGTIIIGNGPFAMPSGIISIDPP